MPTGRGSPGFDFNFGSIFANAPMESGVYVLYKPKVWIFVGECSDIRGRLLQHLHDDNPCITQHSPTRFKFELVAGRTERVAHEHKLVAALNPVCNQTKG